MHFYKENQQPIKEKRLIDGNARRFPFIKNPRLKRRPTLLKDGETININGATIQAIHTPGHTPGSMSYLVGDQFLFTGDTVRLSFNRIRPNFNITNMDTWMQKRSIRKLALLEDISMVCTAHFGYSKRFDAARKAWR